MKLKIHAESRRLQCMSLSPRRIEALGLRPNITMDIRFGIRSARIQVLQEAGLKLNEARLSQDVIEKLQIPLFCHYDMQVRDNALVIGPYASFLTSYKMKTNDQYIKKLNGYLKHYEEVGGAILAFALEGVDVDSNKIKGYLYDPEKKKWIKGSYPYPASIFIRGHVSSEKWRNYFKSKLGSRAVFNDFYLDKWEMHQFLSQSNDLIHYLPETVLYTRPADLVSFLKLFPSAYIKPIHGTMGISIMKAEITPKGLMVSYRKGEENKYCIFTTYDRLRNFLEEALDKNMYIIQRAIPLVTYHDKIIDFRTIIVKNGENQWEYMGAIARYGAENSIISNVSAGGIAEKGEQALQKAFQLTNHEKEEFNKRIADLSLKIARYLDASGLHCGNMGVDIGVDQNKKLWIIEIQHYSPAHSIAVDAGDQNLFQRILRNNLLYMKLVSGFSKGDMS